MKQLLPFSPDLDIQIQAECTRDSKQRLKLVFELRGEVSQIYLPEKSPNPKRRDELWKRTCFEVFFGPEQKNNYWEINLSPTGDWNAYSFTGYREGMKSESKIAGFQTQVVKTPQSLRLEATSDLYNLNLNSAPMKLSVTAVIETLEGKQSYWAFQHSGEKPDFHLGSSFTARF
jgi:hypothetical protein